VLNLNYITQLSQGFRAKNPSQNIVASVQQGFNNYQPSKALTRVFPKAMVLSRFLITVSTNGISPQLCYFRAELLHTFHFDSQVDPEGSEAAAAAGFGIVALSLPPRMVFNKAFTYLLYEKTTKTILFMGRLANPNLG